MPNFIDVAGAVQSFQQGMQFMQQNKLQQQQLQNQALQTELYKQKIAMMPTLKEQQDMRAKNKQMEMLKTHNAYADFYDKMFSRIQKPEDVGAVNEYAKNMGVPETMIRIYDAERDGDFETFKNKSLGIKPTLPKDIQSAMIRMQNPEIDKFMDDNEKPVRKSFEQDLFDRWSQEPENRNKSAMDYIREKSVASKQGGGFTKQSAWEEWSKLNPGKTKTEFNNEYNRQIGSLREKDVYEQINDMSEGDTEKYKQLVKKYHQLVETEGRDKAMRLLQIGDEPEPQKDFDAVMNAIKGSR